MVFDVQSLKSSKKDLQVGGLYDVEFPKWGFRLDF